AGAASGITSVAAVGNETVAAVASAQGVGATSGDAQVSTIKSAVGTASGSSLALAVGGRVVEAIGAASGIGVASAVGHALDVPLIMVSDPRLIVFNTMRRQRTVEGNLGRVRSVAVPQRALIVEAVGRTRATHGDKRIRVA